MMVLMMIMIFLFICIFIVLFNFEKKYVLTEIFEVRINHYIALRII